MSATVIIGGERATIDGYEWTSDNQALEDLLNAMLDPLGPSGADPNPSLTAARSAVDRLSGEVVIFDKPEFDPEAVY